MGTTVSCLPWRGGIAPAAAWSSCAVAFETPSTRRAGIFVVEPSEHPIECRDKSGDIGRIESGEQPSRQRGTSDSTWLKWAPSIDSA
jgi:hypothetical protein